MTAGTKCKRQQWHQIVGMVGDSVSLLKIKAGTISSKILADLLLVAGHRVVDEGMVFQHEANQGHDFQAVAVPVIDSLASLRIAGFYLGFGHRLEPLIDRMSHPGIDAGSEDVIGEEQR